MSASLCSPNSAGACPECNGLGVVYTDLAFMEGYTAVCDTCHGQRFTTDVLQHKLDHRSIADVLDPTACGQGLRDVSDVVPRGIEGG